MSNFINPTVHIGSWNTNIQWYAVCILIGICLAVFLGIKEGKKLGILPDDIYYGLVIVLPVAIIGARLWFVLFNLDQNWTFARILGFENGRFVGLSGLAIQGGVIAAVITVYFYCRKRELSLYRILDLVAPGFLCGQICGRWGNFCNHELFGPRIKAEGLRSFVYNIPFIGENMCLTDRGQQSFNIVDVRHPTFLYESVLNLVGLALMLVLRRKSKKLRSGDLIAIYLMWYGMVRIPTEILRSMSGAGEILMIANVVPVSILVSCIFIVCGVLFFILKRFFGPSEYYNDVVNEIKENKPDTVLFDLDGTLLDTKPLIDRSFVHTFEKFRPDHVLTDEELDSFFGPTLYQSFSRYSNDEDEINAMIDYYRDFNKSHHDEMVKAFPGVKDTLKMLKKGGYKLGVVSSKKNDLVIQGLKHCELFDFFDVIIGADDVTNHKPAPDAILLATEKLASNKTIYVGDTLGDMKAAHNANVKACGVLYIKHPEVMLEAKPDFVINKFNDILRICVV